MKCSTKQNRTLVVLLASLMVQGGAFSQSRRDLTPYLDQDDVVQEIRQDLASEITVLQEVERRVQRADRALGVRVADLNQLLDKMKVKEDRITAIQSNLKTLNEELSTLSEFPITPEMIQNEKTKLEALKTRKGAQTTALDTLKAEKTAGDAKVVELNKKIEGKDNLIEQIQEKLRGEQNQRRRTRGTRGNGTSTTRRPGNGSVTRRPPAVDPNDHSKELADSIEKLKKEKEALVKELKDLEVALSKTVAQISEKEESLKKLSADIEVQEKEVQALENNTKKVDPVRVAEIRKEKSTLTTEMNRLEGELNIQSEIKRDKMNEVKFARRAFQELQGDFRQVKLNVDAISATLQDVEHELSIMLAQARDASAAKALADAQTAANLGSNDGTQTGSQEGSAEGLKAGERDAKTRDYNNGFQQAIADGVSQATTDGETKGQELGKKEGLNLVFQQGKREGEEQGKREGSSSYWSKKQSGLLTNIENGYQLGYKKGLTDGQFQGESVATADGNRDGMKEVVKREEEGTLPEVTVDKGTLQGGLFQANQNPWDQLYDPACHYDRPVVQMICEDAYNQTFSVQAERLYREAYNQAYASTKQQTYAASYNTAFTQPYDQDEEAGYQAGLKSSERKTAMESAYETAKNEALQTARSNWSNGSGLSSSEEAERQKKLNSGIQSTILGARNAGFETARLQDQQDGYNQGKQVGYEKAYQATYPAAKDAGTKAMTSFYQTNAVVKFEGAEIQDQNGDGVLQPGERFSVIGRFRNTGYGTSVNGSLTTQLALNKGKGVRVDELQSHISSIPAKSVARIPLLNPVTVAADATPEQTIQVEFSVSFNGQRPEKEGAISAYSGLLGKTPLSEVIRYPFVFSSKAGELSQLSSEEASQKILSTPLVEGETSQLKLLVTNRRTNAIPSNGIRVRLQTSRPDLLSVQTAESPLGSLAKGTSSETSLGVSAIDRSFGEKAMISLEVLEGKNVVGKLDFEKWISKRYQTTDPVADHLLVIDRPMNEELKDSLLETLNRESLSYNVFDTRIEQTDKKSIKALLSQFKNKELIIWGTPAQMNSDLKSSLKEFFEKNGSILILSDKNSQAQVGISDLEKLVGGKSLSYPTSPNSLRLVSGEFKKSGKSLENTGITALDSRAILLLDTKEESVRQSLLWAMSFDEKLTRLEEASQAAASGSYASYSVEDLEKAIATDIISEVELSAQEDVDTFKNIDRYSLLVEKWMDFYLTKDKKDSNRKLIPSRQSVDSIPYVYKRVEHYRDRGDYKGTFGDQVEPEFLQDPEMDKRGGVFGNERGRMKDALERIRKVVIEGN